MKFKTILPIFALMASACAPQPAEAPEDGVYDPGIFTFAPVPGTKYVQTMKRLEEVAIVGTPMRQTEEWKTTWHMSVGQESNTTLLRAELKGLALSVNGQDLLRGEEVAELGAYMELLLDSKGRVVDIRRTETLTEALLTAMPAEASEFVSRAFAPQVLRMHYVQMANERILDLVGQSARVGHQWGAQSGADRKGPIVKTLKVLDVEPCPPDQCVRVERNLVMEEEAVWQLARGRVEQYVSEQGGDPKTVSVTDAEIKIQDELLVNPQRLRFHATNFDHQATLSVKAPEGDLTVRFRQLRTSSNQF